MKITKEEFDKLPQLDRIEYRQKRDYINSKLNPIQFNYLIIMIIIFSIFISAVTIISIIKPESEKVIKDKLTGGAVWIAVFFFILLIRDISELINNIKLQKELIREYFNLIPKRVQR